MIERDELIAHLRRAPGWSTLGNAAADQIERDEREIERLTAENARLRQQASGMRAILRAGCDLLANEADALREGISIGGEMSPGPEDQNTVDAIREIEDWIATAGTALNARAALNGEAGK